MSQKEPSLLTIEEITKTSAPADAAFTLPAAAYTSEAIYKAEQEKIFRKSWLPVGRVEQVPEVGSFIAADLLDQIVGEILGDHVLQDKAVPALFQQ